MKKNRAFTLIELLVVISIIALLLSILIPSLNKIKQKAREVICKSNLKQVGFALLMYLDQNEGRIFNSSRSNGFLWFDGNGDYLDTDNWDAYWGIAYKDYIEDPDIFGCPSFRNVAELIYPVDPQLIHQSAYTLNSYIINKRVTQIQNHARVIFSHDHAEPRVENGTQDMFYNDGPGTENLKQYRYGGSRSKFYRGIFRHNIKFGDPFRTGGQANILWLDSHVESLQETTGDNVPEKWYTGS